MLIQLTIVMRHVIQQLGAARKMADQLFTVLFKLGFILFQFELQRLLLAQFAVAETHGDGTNDDTDD
jgi:CRISPR/Cas system-associated protein endoribonuclease Cas2